MSPTPPPTQTAAGPSTQSSRPRVACSADLGHPRRTDVLPPRILSPGPPWSSAIRARPRHRPNTHDVHLGSPLRPNALTAHKPRRRWWVPGPVAQLLIMVLMAAAVPAGVVGEINDTVVIAAVGTTVKVDREPTVSTRPPSHGGPRPCARQVGEHRPHSAKPQVGSAPASEKPRKPLTKPISRIMLPWRASGPSCRTTGTYWCAWPVTRTRACATWPRQSGSPSGRSS